MTLFAQQDEQYTQFMFNKLRYNSAYAGSNNALNFTAIYRNQWINFNGAPKTQIVSFDMPVANYRVGLGGNVVVQTIGITDMATAEAAYAYRVPTNNIGGSLSFGLSTSARYIRSNYNQANPTQPRDLDEAIPVGRQSKIVPNFGAGVYYNTETFYLGFSAPRLLESNIDFADAEDKLDISREVRHFYFMGGVVFQIADPVKLQPQALLKYTPDAPFDADVNLSVILLDRFTVGASYRIGGSLETSYGESADVLVAAQVTDNILIGAAYDFTFTEVKDYSNGSVEVAVRIFLGDRGGNSGNQTIVNPRFF